MAAHARFQVDEVADTQAAFEEADFWGLQREQVFFLTQGMLPAVDPEGRLLLADRGALALSPDGHGGCFEALSRSGAPGAMVPGPSRQIRATTSRPGPSAPCGRDKARSPRIQADQAETFGPIGPHMRKLALLAAAAALVSVNLASAGTVTARIVEVDPAKRTITLDDKTIMIIGKDVDLTAVTPGQKVIVTANEDDNGFAPATKITPVQ